MKKNAFSTLGLITVLVTGATNLQAEQTGRGVGTGIIYPAPNFATVLNPAAIVDSPNISLLGLYRFDPKTPFVSLTTSAGFWGAGISYREEGTDTNIIEGSLGLTSTFILLGGTFRKVNDQEANADVAIMFDLGGLRLGAVLRDVDGGADRVDTGIAFKLADNAYVEFNIKKGRPFNDKVYLGDAAVVLHAHDWTIGVGYDFWIDENKKVQDGDIHAGVSLMLANNFYADVHYRLMNQEWQAQDWSAGARLLF
ncbi:hypothetical protein GW915_11295 [bacterium]|nr:hypothetical protein [bacterium]